MGIWRRDEAERPAVAVNPAPLTIDWGPDARPVIAVDRQGRIAVVFDIFKDKEFNGQVLYTHSQDGGRSFAEPKPITADAESQRFQAVAFDPDGALFAAETGIAAMRPTARKAAPSVSRDR